MGNMIRTGFNQANEPCYQATEYAIDKFLNGSRNGHGNGDGEE